MYEKNLHSKPNFEDSIAKSIALLCRSVPSFAEQSTADRQSFLLRLGFHPNQAESVTEIFETIFGETHGDPSEISETARCPISWRPSISAPVSSGFTDINLDLFPPNMFFNISGVLDSTLTDPISTQLRIFYPTLEPQKSDAQLLIDCGLHPLVILIHGQCPLDIDAYRLWYHLPQQLARAGYVVVVPKLLQVSATSDKLLTLAERVVGWMRTHWQYRFSLAEPTAIIGHSMGAIIGCRLAASIPASAYISLSGAWHPNLNQATRTQFRDALSIPSMFVYGDGGDDADSNFESDSTFFTSLRTSKHKVLFSSANHFDYLQAGTMNPCSTIGVGHCKLTKFLAADISTAFLTRYMQPPGANVSIDPGLNYQVDVASLTPLQKHYYSQEFMAGFNLLNNYQVDIGFPLLTLNCQINHTWVLQDGTEGNLILPSSP